jgi:hypothetical protein
VAAVEGKWAGAALAGAIFTPENDRETSIIARAKTAMLFVRLTVAMSSALSLDKPALFSFSAISRTFGRNKDADVEDQCIGFQAGISHGVDERTTSGMKLKEEVSPNHQY